MTAMLARITTAISMTLLALLAPAIFATAANAQPPGASAAAATTSGDVGALAWCTSARPVSGSVPDRTFAGSQSTACLKCDEYGRYLRAKGDISAYACEYYPALGYARIFVRWI